MTLNIFNGIYGNALRKSPDYEINKRDLIQKTSRLIFCFSLLGK